MGWVSWWLTVTLATTWWPTRTAGSDLQFIHTGGFVDNNFYDEDGRVRIFHGVNRVPKFSPWYFEDMLNSEAEFELMESLGITVVRLGYMWSGYNPAPNVFNATYMSVVKAIIAKFNERGIYVLLDMHQDGLSSKFCLYDGAPLWVINKSMPVHEFPWPLPGNCSRFWEYNELAEATATAYQDIYDNKHGMLDDLAAFWSHSANEFRDIPGIIGYEIMNEPFAGNFYADPTILVPGIAGHTNLERMHDAVATKIREVDDRHAIFFEPVTWGMIFDGKIAGSGFDHVPGGAQYANRSVFSYHYYCASWLPGYNHEPFWTRIVCDDTMAKLVFKAVGEDTGRFGGGAMMTEGLACDTTNMTTAKECIEVMDMLDDNLYSWTDYGSSQGATWEPNLVEQQIWARPYARAVAGKPVKMSFDAFNDQHDFLFCWTLDLRIKSPTEIFASAKFTYPKAIISIPPELTYTQPTNSDDTYLFTPTKDAKDGAQVCVNIHNSP